MWKGEFQICYCSMHSFRQVASLLSQTSYGTATGKGKYGVYLRGLLECRENHSLICLKSGNSSEKEVFKQVEGEKSLAGDPRVLTDVQFP